MPALPYVPLLLATLLSVQGYTKKSLSPSGAAAAFLVGTFTLAGGLRVFGVLLIVFYLVGSRATKYGKQRKALLEDAHQDAGYRSGWQVLCNSATALVACTAWNVLFAPDSLQAFFLRPVLSAVHPVQRQAYDDKWCPTEGDSWSRMLVYIAVGHFACCLGDTLASELGVLSASQPILITTLKRVPPGTNGGISTFGTLASVAGGTIMGTTAQLCLVLESGCGAGTLAALPLCGALCGGVGSMIDSLLGATVQETRYSVERKKILASENYTAEDRAKALAQGEIVSGLDWLSNNQVNVVSSVLTALGAGLVSTM